MTEPDPSTSDDAAFTRPHVATVDPRDPGFCRCGLGLEAYVHTDSTRYVSRPLTRQVWEELRGGS